VRRQNKQQLTKMFNLLRRTRQRKTHKNKIYDVSDDEEAATTTTAATSRRATAKSTESECRKEAATTTAT